MPSSGRVGSHCLCRPWESVNVLYPRLPQVLKVAKIHRTGRGQRENNRTYPKLQAKRDSRERGRSQKVEEATSKVRHAAEEWARRELFTIPLIFL